MEQFNRLLDEYKTQYLFFLTSGEQKYKDAYNAVLTRIEEMISEKQAKVDAEKHTMKQFASSYKQDKQTDTIDAQSLHDEYITSKVRYDTWTEQPVLDSPAIDVTNGYNILWRIGVCLIVLPVLVLVGYNVPLLGQMNAIRVG